MHANKNKQRYSRRRIAALNFLSNISLDGSHQELKSSYTASKDYKENQQLSNKQADDYAVTCSFPVEDKHSIKARNDFNPISTSLETAERNRKELEEVPKREHSLFDRVKHFSVDTGKQLISKASPDSRGQGRVTGFRERSATVGSCEKSSPILNQRIKVSALNQLGLSAVCHPLIIPGITTLSLHSDNHDTSHESVEMPVIANPASSSYLLPISLQSHSISRRLSSNASDGSHSPTGSGLREKEVRFLTNFKDVTNQVNDQRMVLVTSQCSPIVVYSVLSFSRNNKLVRGEARGESGRRRQISGTHRPASSVGDYPDLYTLLGLPKPEEGQVISYSQMLVPSHVTREGNSARRLHSVIDQHDVEALASRVPNPLVRCYSHDTSSAARANYGRSSSPVVSIDGPKIDNEEGVVSTMNYHPSLLDNPELWIAGKHSTLLTFPSYMTSVIDYVKPSDLKKELNNKFKERFPHIQLTLSKLRSLKREMRKVAKQDSGTDLLTIAQAYVYFEKLILRGLVHKGNRKLCAGASLLLSAKMNDVKGEALKNLIEEIQNSFRVSKREIFSFEFAVLVALEFSLHVPTWEIFPHYQRLLYDS